MRSRVFDDPCFEICVSRDVDGRHVVSHLHQLGKDTIF